MGFKYWIQKIMASVAIGWGVLFFLIMLIGMDEESVGTLIFITIILGVFPFLLGLFLLKNLKPGEKKEPRSVPTVQASEEDRMEKLILQLAQRHGGMVTPADIALNSSYSLKRAEEMLERMRQNGYAKIRVADNGTYVYQITHLLSDEQKNNSERII